MDTGSSLPSLLAPTEIGVEDRLAGRYRLERRLGRGGMAEVFAARDEVLHRQVAVKVFPPQFTAEAERNRPQDEVRLLASLNHPCLVSVHDAGAPTSASPAFLVMELVPGPTLSLQLREHGPLAPHQAAALGAQISAALAYVHARNLIHRDVKPANILLREALTGTDVPPVGKLADFGIARLVDATRVTRTGTALGTASYLSPEQVRGETVGPPIDVYALGLVLLESLTGTVTYPGNAVESAVARLHRNPEIPADLPTGLRDLLSAMTDGDPALRPGAAEVAETLATITADQAPASPTRSSRRRDTRPVPRRTLLPTRTPHSSPWLHWRRRPSRAVAAASAATLLTVLVLSWAGFADASEQRAPAPPRPSYPSVPGPLGADLDQLQKAVQR